MAELHYDRNSLGDDGRPWYADMTRYHWFVLMVAALGWLFDCLDQQLFTLARVPALKDLLGLPQSAPEVKSWSGRVTMIFLIGWATGGLFFGVLGDRIGRAKTMMLTILLYSLCTGLSSFSVGVWDFALYRFLTGLGVGGEFAVGVALVAEVMPDRARARSLSLLQALSAIGNMSAAGISIGLGRLEETGVLGQYSPFGVTITAWRVMFLIGALPALLALVIRRRLKEPERWQAVSHEGEVQRKLGSYAELFRHPTWRRHAIIGLLLAAPGVIGLWGIGFFSADLSRSVFRKHFAQEVYGELISDANSNNDPARAADLQTFLDAELSPTPTGAKSELSEMQAALKKQADDRITGALTTYAGLTLLMQQIGAFLGMYSFGWMAQKVGRRPTFLLAFIMAMLTTAMVFWYLDQPRDIFWMVSIMGFFQLSLFAGYAIYFPELFPTYLRSTGTSFCYNVGRFVAAVGPFVFGVLTSSVFHGEQYPDPMPYRYAGVTMCSIFLVGIVTLAFAPETKDRPLPE
jgi:MFS family permease